MGFLRRFMYGRYGADQLGVFTLVLYLVLYVAGGLTRLSLLQALALVPAVVTLYRMLSRNIPRRQAENRRFMGLTAPAREWWRRTNLRRTDKHHKYFKCPRCGQHLRVPRGAGKIKVTCRSCGTSFEENS